MERIFLRVRNTEADFGSLAGRRVCQATVMISNRENKAEGHESLITLFFLEVHLVRVAQFRASVRSEVIHLFGTSPLGGLWSLVFVKKSVSSIGNHRPQANLTLHTECIRKLAS